MISNFGIPSRKAYLIYSLIIFIPFSSHAQKQLVFLHHESVIARFTEGEYFTCVLKNGQKKKG
ncbi:MAG: hypothetical protein ACKODM_15255, partial [Cytophagales bacterium]